MGAPKPWPTHWPEPEMIPSDPDIVEEPLEDPDYGIEENPGENPYRLPEENLATSITWGVTHPCNLRCTHCYDVVDYKRKDLNTSDALAAIDRLAVAGFRFVVFSGGEPLLRKDLYQLMARCGERTMGFAMRSNVTLVTKNVAQNLANLGLAVCGVSLDGATAAIHDAVRGAGSFQKTMSGIKSLRQFGIRVNVEIVLSKRNAFQSLDFVQLAENLDVQEINFSTITPQGRGVYLHEDRLDYALWRELTTTLYHASLKAKVNVSPSSALVGTCWSCVEPNITCDGWVTPCYLSKRKLFHILEAAPEDIQTRLQALRPQNLDVCGRREWIPSRLNEIMTP